MELPSHVTCAVGACCARLVGGPAAGWVLPCMLSAATVKAPTAPSNRAVKR
jgi:hypothetical protein